MSKFEILCVTMQQNDFSKVQEMNIHCDVVFANQANSTGFSEMEFEGHRARMITTDTRGVGNNRNLALIYAQGDVCLLADDDVTYYDGVEEKVLSEFNAHPDADIIIFNLDSDSERSLKPYQKTEKRRGFYRMPWGAPKIAFRLSSVRKANLWFSTLFGGGTVFLCGEDSLWLSAARQKGLTFYVSKETLGSISYEESTWFTGYDERYFFGQGAVYKAMRPKSFWIWMLYSVVRTWKYKELTVAEKFKWIKLGRDGYGELKGYSSYHKAKER